MKIRLTILVGFALLLTVSCRSDRNAVPMEIIPEKTMTSLLMEMHLTDALLTKDPRIYNQKTGLTGNYYPSLLQKYRVTQAQVDSSVRWYVKNPRIYNRIYEKVVSDLEKRLSDARERDTLQPGP